MSFDSKDFKKNSPFMNSNSTDFEDSRLERVNSAPPQSSSLFEEESPFSFVLTNEDGTPLQIESSEESDDSNNRSVEEKEKLKELQDSIDQLSLIEVQSRMKIQSENKEYSNKNSSNDNNTTKYYEIGTSSTIHNENCIGTPSTHSEFSPITTTNINISHSIQLPGHVHLDLQVTDKTHSPSNKASCNTVDNWVLDDTTHHQRQSTTYESNFKVQKIQSEKGQGDWEIEMDSEGTDNTDDFSKFMSIEKLISEFSSSHTRETVPQIPNFQISDREFNAEMSVPELKDKLKALSIDSVYNELEDWDFEFESDENQNLSDFVKFMQIEKLAQQFPEVNTVNVIDEILNILNMKERQPVEINFINTKIKGNEKLSIDTAASKIQNLKNKVSTGIEKIRIEFNRATGTNVSSVIDNIKKIQIEKVQEMKEVAAFVFEKIISEPIYFEVYLQIVGQLKESNWKCEEEMKMVDKTQTCFFGTLLSLAKKRLEADHDWFAAVDESVLSYSNRMDLEEQIEDKVADKIKKKEHALGTVNFLVSLYLKNITSLSNAQMVIDRLLSKNSPEYIVMLCYIYKPLIEKLVHMNRNDLANRIITYLKANEKSTSDVRLQLVIEKAVKYNPLNTTAPKAIPQNSFAGMLTQESESTPTKSDAEVLQSYITDIVNAVSGFVDEDEVIEYGDKVYRDIDRFNNSEFFTAYLIELVSNYKYFKRLLDILLLKLLPKLIDINEVLGSLKDEMEMLSIDVGCASKNYAELLCYLRGLNKLNKVEFESFKLPQFFKHSSSLLKNWKEAEDSRLPIVATDEEIQKLNSF